jgi:hypothetical protein
MELLLDGADACKLEELYAGGIAVLLFVIYTPDPCSD